MKKDTQSELIAKIVCDQTIQSLKDFTKACKEDGLNHTTWYKDFMHELRKIYENS